MQPKLISFLAAKEPEIARLSQAEALAYWQATTTGETRYEQEYARYREDLLRFLANREDFAELSALKDSDGVSDPLYKRQLALLYNSYLENQLEPKLISQIVKLETEVESAFTTFRAEYQGRTVSNNDLNDVLENDLDTAHRQAAWEASKLIGPQVADKVVALVRLRNTAARSLGFSDYHQMALTVAEIEPAELFSTLKELKTLTDEPFRRLKQSLDSELAQKFKVQAIMPWHYSDPFFQEAPATGELDLNKYFKHQDIVELARRFYRGLGLPVEQIIERSDLYERAGKYQHAYSTDIDRAGDVRILCNLRNDEIQMNTLLHELGHAVYDTYRDPSLPFLLRTPAHTLTTEAVAILMGRLTKNPAWLIEIAGAPEAEITRFEAEISNRLALSELIFIRWALVVVYFEREMYANPEQNLNSLWWDLVEDLQLVKKPSGRQAPDWAAKIHIASAPAYYQNYILGELTASQLTAALKKAGASPALSNRETGRFLREKIFNSGSCYKWNDLIAIATGEPLSAKYFAAQFVR